jgi:hypothetical protein
MLSHSIYTKIFTDSFDIRRFYVFAIPSVGESFDRWLNSMAWYVF